MVECVLQLIRVLVNELHTIKQLKVFDGPVDSWIK